MDLNFQRFVREISRELDVDEDVVKEACQSEFSFVVEKMREYKDTDENAPILLNHLGKFKVKSRRMKYLRKDDRLYFKRSS